MMWLREIGNQVLHKGPCCCACYSATHLSVSCLCKNKISGNDICACIHFSANVQTCTNKFTDKVRGFARCCKRVQVEVKLWAMDALAMCDHGLSDIACFDAIDTSNLADNVELLNLILMAVPRLETHPSARSTSATHSHPVQMCTSAFILCRAHLELQLYSLWVSSY